MRRSQIAPGVHLSYDAAQKFNRCRISIHFAFPARRETATAHALLPLVMERGYADCPDMTQMTKKLARLYGADLTVDARPMGCSHNLCVSITGIKDQFALEGEKLTQEYAALALGTAFHPYFVGSTFDPEAVGIEKQMLKKALEDEVNDKRLYCQRQANREFFGDSPAGVRQEGYLEEVDGLTPEALTEAYCEMLRTANIELIVLGCDEASTTAVKEALLAELSAIDRAPLPRAENIAMPRREPVRKVEHFDTTQAKLCMLFTLGRPMQPEQLAAVRLAMALYGGSVTSRLFLNVRERDHLCYYCSSSFQSFTGSMAVNSGVEHTDAARAEQAVLKELADLCDGPITDEELEAQALAAEAAEEAVMVVPPAEEEQPVDEIAQEQEKPTKEGFFARLKRSLLKTKENLGSGFISLFRGKKIDDDLFEELEEQLLIADVGVETTRKIITNLTEGASRKQLRDAEALYGLLKEEMGEILAKVDEPLNVEGKTPFVILMVGVNGVGKTTTIGKLARQFEQQGKSVMLAAGDTFRAAAVEQLQVWGQRNNIPVIAQHTGADSASVIFDAIQAAKARNIDVLIADTAGRLQNKSHLMEELKKIVRVMKKLDVEAPHEVMLTIDASTGQNAVSQAKLFHEAVGLTGITLTKLDGTAKGGVIFSVADQFGIPIRYIGVGERIEDLRPFKADDFIEALFARED